MARASQLSARNKFEVAEGMALSTTSLSLDKGLEFPFLTIPDVEVQAINSRKLSDTDLLAYAPLVSLENRREWETYAQENQDWLRQSLDFIGKQDVNPGSVPPRVYGTRDFLDPSHNQGYHPDLEKVMAPLWYVF